MSLLQISEPNQSPNPHKHRYAIGIDLGTTNSLVAVVQSGMPKILPIDNSNTMPSVVHYGADGVVVGKAALSFLPDFSKDTIISAKRFMGRTLGDIKFSHGYQLVGEQDSMPSFVTQSGEVSPVAVSAQILQKLYHTAQSALPDNSIEGAVITVPAYFDEAQRAATKEAARACGIKVLRLLNEPTAAALAYGLDKNDEGDTVLVYDLGGGTFDVSIMTMRKGVFEVIATGGNSALGGDDIDRLIANDWLKQAGLDPKTIAPMHKSALARLAKIHKECLTDNAQLTLDTKVLYAEAIAQIGLDLTAIEFDHRRLTAIAAPVLSRTLKSCEQALSDAKLSKNAIDNVILVGGSSRMPIVIEALTQFFGKTPLCRHNPDEVVALGAAILANQLINKREDNVLLLDVTPLSLGLETMGSLVEVIIPRNTPIPITKRTEFTTHSDGQTGMVIHVVQGERDTVEHCRSLARFELFGIPPQKAGIARVEVSFAIDVNGQLTVSAKELSTGVESSINVIPSNGLSPSQQEALLMAGFDHAKEDKEIRMLIEAKVEAQREISAIQSALGEFDHLLNDEQITQLNHAIYELQDAINSDNQAQIDQKNQALKTHSDHFASAIMNQSIKTALSGTNADDWIAN